MKNPRIPDRLTVFTGIGVALTAGAAALKGAEVNNVQLTSPAALEQPYQGPDKPQLQLVQTSLGEIPSTAVGSGEVPFAPTPLLHPVKTAEPLPGPTNADRSPGTPGPEESTPPQAGLGPNQPNNIDLSPKAGEPDAPVVVGIPNGAPEALGPDAAESMQVVVPARPPKLAFTGPMEITASPFDNDQNIVGHPAVLAGQSGHVVSIPDPNDPRFYNHGQIG